MKLKTKLTTQLSIVKSVIKQNSVVDSKERLLKTSFILIFKVVQ